MVQNTSITSALKIFAPLLDALESAYWDSYSIEIKDRVFDLITCVHGETNELAKLSVSDLDMPYEPITPGFAGSCKKLNILMSNIDTWFPRSRTAAQLKVALADSAALIKNCKI